MVTLSVLIVTSCLLPFCGGISPASQKFSQATNAFSINFYKNIPDEKQNILTSPLSVAMSLSMVLFGARANTVDEIANTLLFSAHALTKEELLVACKAFIVASKMFRKGLQFNFVNSLWLQQGLTPLPNYTSILANVFETKEQFVDFESPDSMEIINNWVAETTHNTIQNLFKQPLRPETKIALVNAVYLNGTWSKQFEATDTEDRPFFNFGNTKKIVPTMQERSEHLYTVSDHLSAHVLQLDYHDHDLSMVVLLPTAGNSLKSVESKLNITVLNDVFSQLSQSSAEVLVLLPKFRVELTLSLKEILTGLGIKHLFRNTADLSGITGEHGHKVSEMVQKSVIKVNEKGTETATVTETVMTLLSLPDFVFNADRPFMYIIKHNPTNTIIFMGRVVEL